MNTQETVLTRFEPIALPYLHGRQAQLNCGLTVEVVRVDSVCGWNLFIVDKARKVAAMSIEQYRRFGYRDFDRSSAMKIATRLLSL